MTPLTWVLLAFPLYLLVEGKLMKYLTMAVPNKGE